MYEFRARRASFSRVLIGCSAKGAIADNLSIASLLGLAQRMTDLARALNPIAIPGSPQCLLAS